MEREIWRIWGVRELLNTVGPEATIRELKKRCEAGAIVGCALYKQLIQTWMKVALELPEGGARTPAELFMAAAGEDVWVERIEQLHEKNPPKIVDKELVSGIPRSIRFDLREEFNADFDRRVGKKIPTDPKMLTKEDILQSKKITEDMHRPLAAAPKPLPPPAIEIPRKPPEVTPPKIPRKPTEALPELPELELMKKEIEERIRKMLLEKKGGKEGVREAPPSPEKKRGSQAFGYKEFKDSIAKTTVASDLILLGETIYWSERLTVDEKRELGERLEMRFKELGIETVKILGAPPMVVGKPEPYKERSEEERMYRDMYKGWTYTRFWDDILKTYDLVEISNLIRGIHYSNLQQDEKKRLLDYAIERVKILKGMIVAEKEITRENLGDQVREDGDALTEPKDYSQWIYADFESILNEVDPEDLWELYENVGVSKRLTAVEADELRARILARIEIEKGE